MRNCVCHDLPACKTGYGIRVLDHNLVVVKDIPTGLSRREAVLRYWGEPGHKVQLMGHRRVVAERS